MRQSYFADHKKPKNPRDLASHRCLRYRHLRMGGTYAREFQDKGQPLQVRVEGPLTARDSLLSATIERTDEPLSTGIEALLPWLTLAAI